MKFSELQRLQRREGLTVLSADERIEQLEARLRAVTKERDALRAKIAEMERQEPVAWLHESRRDSDVVTNAVKHVWGKTAVGSMAAYSIPLYASPVAQPELNLSDPAVQKRLATQWGYVQKPHPDCDSGCMFQCAQPAPSVPECPYPCGWRNLLKHAIEDGAYLARSINEDEPVTENARAVAMRMVMQLRDVLMTINKASPETKP